MEKFPINNKKETSPNLGSTEFTTEELEDAREHIKNRWSEGIRPVVTLPQKYLPYLEKGLRPHSTWIPGLEVIAGTFDREPYAPSTDEEAEPRVAATIEIPPENIEPRFTGPKKTFNGVVVLRGPIPPESIHISSLH